MSLQRATEPGAEEAVANMPFLPGDRVWSDAQGRAEFQFADGAILRLDHGSKLDYVAHEEGDGARVILRLWSGSLTLHPAEGRGAAEFVVETPGGVLVPQRRGVYRVDVDSGETRVSVYEGEAVLEADRRLTLRAGERAYARGGEAYGEPETFDRAEADDFGRWDAERYAETRVAQADVPEYLPEDIAPYADELRDHGAWLSRRTSATSGGRTWMPAGRPYHNGRWIWTSYGWTWLPYERWGWAPFHYGRWDHAPALGWYWVPGRRLVARPGWTGRSAATTSAGVRRAGAAGACPRDARRPAGRCRGAGTPTPGSTRAAATSARATCRRRVAFDTAVPRNMTLLEPHAVVTRDVRVGHGAGGGRRRARRGAAQRSDEAARRTTRRRSAPPPARAPGAAGRGRHPRRPPRGLPPAAAPAGAAAAPTPGSRGRSHGRRARGPRAGSATAERAAATPSPEADRDVLRPVFRPLSRPRPDAAEPRPRHRCREPARRRRARAAPCARARGAAGAAARAGRPARRALAPRAPSVPRRGPSPVPSSPTSRRRRAPAGTRATRRKRDN